MREGWTVGRRRGVALADDYVAQQLAAADALPDGHEFVDAERPARGQSARSAVAVRGGGAHGGGGRTVPAPVSATLFAAVKPYINGARS